jgi:hypothetical protein
VATMSIRSNDGALDSAAAVLEVTATNPDYNQPALRIKQASKRGGAASIRIDDPKHTFMLNASNRVRIRVSRRSTEPGRIIADAFRLLKT